MKDGSIPEGLTFDDVLLLPGKSSVLPAEVDTQTNFTRRIAEYSAGVGGDGYGDGIAPGDRHGAAGRDRRSCTATCRSSGRAKKWTG